LDLAIAVPALVVLSPLLGLIALVAWAGMGRPVLFGQSRAGLGGRPFTLWKFRTMTDARDARGAPLPDEQRLTRLGRWLRRTSLDELPELLNVARGDMSLVGPRPLLAQYLPRYAPWQARRHEVRPGITGWAQVNGRNATTWDQRFRLDVWYVDHVSAWLDLRILLRTPAVALTSKGVSARGHATMPEFRGEEGPF
jgi:lipopolysaccharide/colanic/teichoic acid biosynthesis glycosyltransferase